MKTDQKLKTWCTDGVCVTVCVPVAFRNKCERVTDPQPERVRSIFAGVNATRTSGTGPERDRNANRNKCEHSLSKRLVTVTACLDRMHWDKVNWIHCFPRGRSIFGSNIFLPSRCYTVAGWRLDQTKGDHGTVSWSLNCQLMGHNQYTHNLEIMKDN